MKGPVAVGPMGVVSCLGAGPLDTLASLLEHRRNLRPVTVFPVAKDSRLPVGEINFCPFSADLPRTHQLARHTADQIFSISSVKPDAIVLGTTTGGISRTEELLLSGEKSPDEYQLHGANTVAMDLARRYQCSGPVLTISAACASGAMAIALGAAMIRKGLARRVLAGGVDGLCRLTYFGFKSLQLIDPEGARPLDQNRRGMSVAEGAGLVLLCAEPEGEIAATLLGSGLSCDAHHAVAPHPEGIGAMAAMEAALTNAGLRADQVDYINLHGTATPDNDRSEARALRAMFGSVLPDHSSIKGAMGHSLAASGAIEAVVSALCLKEKLIPANVGMTHCDPELNLSPTLKCTKKPLNTILSNSFGFGGSNAALVFGSFDPKKSLHNGMERPASFSVLSYTCVSGAGFLAHTAEAMSKGRPFGGCLDSRELSNGLNPVWIRRAKRLTRLALGLAIRTCPPNEENLKAHAMALGTGWGALSETHEFLNRLFQSNFQFPSPTDFIGSVHNAPAGQIAQFFNIKGPNITTSGGDNSFEQALLSAGLMSESSRENYLVLGVDEAHPALSPLLAPYDKNADLNFADGGGALLLSQNKPGIGVTVDLAFYGLCNDVDDVEDQVARLIAALKGVPADQQFSALLVGIPSGCENLAKEQLKSFKRQSGFSGYSLDYRRLLGHFAGASAVATVLGVHWVKEKKLCITWPEPKTVHFREKGILHLNLGHTITAVRILP